MEKIYIQIGIYFLQLILTNMNVEDFSIKNDPGFLIFKEGEKIVLIGDFGAQGMNDKIVLCNNKSYDKCGFVNEQKILLWTSKKCLIQISHYPWDYGDNIYFHIVKNGKPQGTGYKFWLGYIYDRETPIDKGAPW